MKGSAFEYLLNVRSQRGAGYLVLIDPDRKNDGILEDLVTTVNESEADAILMGGSLFMDGRFQERAAKVRETARVPVILFPGAANQLGPHCDAVLFMSVISGRNPNYLIGEQVIAAPIVKDLGLEPIPTGYLLFDGGGNSTVEFMSNSKPLPLNRPDIAIAHGLAAEYLGMKLLYLEAGSGARQSVPEKTIRSVASEVSLPLIVGGGIRTGQEARSKVKAGASFIVTGTAIEDPNRLDLLNEFADAIHGN
ncbi:MAG: geranylgeranylglyceryl/heptaprenylglyceryl phosphate synthase [Candidatus Neomarinimicrobiota bacterium]